MRFVLLAIVLTFPLIDLYVTARVARWTGMPVWAWLIPGLVAGLWLLRVERLSFRTNTLAALHGEQSLLRGLVDSGRKVLAGLLFMLPGVVSDAFGLMLLMLPINHGRYDPQPVAAGRPAPGRPAARPARRSTATSAASTEATAACRRRYLNRSSSVGSSFPARRYAQIIIASPTAIIGSDSHWPIVRPSAR